MTAACDDPRFARLVERFKTLQAADVARLGEHYAAEVRFKDPFNDVAGLAAVQRIFAHMFEALDAPHFKVHEVVAQGDRAFLTWDFIFRFKRGDPGCRPFAAPRTWCWMRRAASSCTATTGTRPRSCTKSCRCSAR